MWSNLDTQSRSLRVYVNLCKSTVHMIDRTQGTENRYFSWLSSSSLPPNKSASNRTPRQSSAKRGRERASFPCPRVWRDGTDTYLIASVENPTDDPCVGSTIFEIFEKKEQFYPHETNSQLRRVLHTSQLLTQGAFCSSDTPATCSPRAGSPLPLSFSLFRSRPKANAARRELVVFDRSARIAEQLLCAAAAFQPLRSPAAAGKRNRLQPGPSPVLRARKSRKQRLVCRHGSSERSGCPLIQQTTNRAGGTLNNTSPPFSGLSDVILQNCSWLHVAEFCTEGEHNRERSRCIWQFSVHLLTQSQHRRLNAEDILSKTLCKNHVQTYS